jgi:hypothetical protein
MTWKKNDLFVTGFQPPRALGREDEPNGDFIASFFGGR